MGMSTHVVAFKPPDEKWQAMKAVYDACNAAGVDPPSDVIAFFNDSEPDESGVEISSRGPGYKLLDWCREWDDGNGRAGYEVVIEKLPKDVSIVRFFNSW